MKISVNVLGVEIFSVSSEQDEEHELVLVDEGGSESPPFGFRRDEDG